MTWGTFSDDYQCLGDFNHGRVPGSLRCSGETDGSIGSAVSAFAPAVSCDKRTLSTCNLSIDASAPTLLQAARLAPRWFAHAKREAASADLDSRRHEILFAVCFVESYLLEWVRDEVLSPNSAELNE